MNKVFFGKTPCGNDVYSYTISDGLAEAKIMTYGATILSFKPFNGIDVIAGFDSFEDYLKDTSNQGAIVGRVANRIADACIEIDGKQYQLTNNNNGNCLHSGIGFQHRLWKMDEYSTNSVVLSYFSQDGEDGFPGNLSVRVKYTVLNSSLYIEYNAVSDATTPIALTNHAYFNLNGLGEDIRSHKLKIYANTYTEVNEKLIPNGNHPSVHLTTMDFREMHSIDKDYDSFEGYDINMVLSPVIYKTFNNTELGLGAVAEGNNILMNVYTDQPGVQFYTGNFLGKGPNFRGNIPQIKYGAFCLETQTEPNCVKHGQGIYNAGEVYKHFTVYEFKRLI